MKCRTSLAGGNKEYAHSKHVHFSILKECSASSTHFEWHSYTESFGKQILQSHNAFLPLLGQSGVQKSADQQKRPRLLTEIQFTQAARIKCGMQGLCIAAVICIGIQRTFLGLLWLPFGLR